MKTCWLALCALALLTSLVGCNDPPQLQGVSPNSGPLGGGTAITVNGTNFDARTKVSVGGLICSNIAFQGSGAIDATTPPGTALGSADVEVINSDGQRSKMKGAFTYSTAPTNPTITTVTPASGSANTLVTITGTNFQDLWTVTFGTVAGTNLVETGGTSITCDAPPGVTGIVSVIVTNPDGGTVTFPSAFNFGGTASTTTTSGGTAGTIETFAGSGTEGSAGDGGAATSAALAGPMGLAVGSDQSVYISDTNNNRIRQVGTNGIIETVAGGSAPGFADGAATTAALLRLPRGIAIDTAGTVYIADTGNHAIRTLTGGTIATIAGTGGTSGNTGDSGLATAALCNGPSAVSVDGQFNIIFADTGNNRARRINATTKDIANFAGSATGQSGFGGDGALSSAALLAGPEGVVIDISTAIVYIADTGNNRIRKVDTSNNITTFAGAGTEGFSGDGGLATSAQLTGPTGLAFDSSQNLYMCDTQNQRVRTVSSNLTITTFAGSGTSGFAGDGGAATSASLSLPFGVAVNTSSNVVYIADSGDGSVRDVPD